ncbi:MAG: hypothetical protein EP330_14005 [Deltaproteobacteria bacterium]|nr:MAG: hypothetical protein EP330_14005 [Deltaproteobacteria bacterium]
MALNAEELDRRFTAIRERYRTNFTGHPRATRDLALLDALIEENRTLVAEAFADVGGQLQQNLDFMLGERQAIASAKEQGQTIPRVTAWHDLLQAHYRHRFAGRSRATRDLGLLREMVEHYGQLIAEVEAAGTDESVLKSLTAAKAMYEREIKEIDWARKSGSESDRVQRYARLANEQLALYRRHFAGNPRVSRSVPLLRRVVQSITEIRGLMLQLPVSGPNAGPNAGNIKLLGDKLKTFKKEIELVEQAKRDQGLPAVADSIGGAANKLFQEYRNDFAGQSRQTRSLEQLFHIIDGLVHLARELEAAVEQPETTETHANNLRIIMDHIRIYTREVDQIVDAQRSGRR